MDPKGDRFDTSASNRTMKAVVTTGAGGYDRMDYRDVPVPQIARGEVLLQVLAAGVNNTEINTRLGWYSSGVTEGTDETARASDAEWNPKTDGGWNEETPFPFIQGTDCCGRVVSVAASGDETLLGRRVLVRPCIRPNGFGSAENIWMGSDFDGAFAQYVKVPAREVFPVESDWSDAELASIPCACGTAENMLQRARVQKGEHILVTGASGGVGSAVVQLAKVRGAIVTAVAGASKMEPVRSIGADQVVARGSEIDLSESAFDAVVDNVVGPAFGGLLKALKRGGRYVSSGAIGGPLVTLDMRDLYLKDLTLIGCTAWDEPVFPAIISLIERNALQPVVAKIFPLERIADAQREFLEKKHFGKFVLSIPPLPG